MSQPAPLFHEVLEFIEHFNIEQQETLLEIVQHRLRERKREALIERVTASRAEFERGEVIRGNAADIMKAISE
jgi:hypothetical protein